MNTLVLTSSFSPVRRALLSAALSSSLLASARAAIVNPGFESGTTGWTESGGSGNFITTASLTGLYGSVAPAAGATFGFITNNGVATDLISQSFTVPAGASFLSFNYRFLSDGLNDPAFNDAAQALLTPAAGSAITLFSVSRDDLQSGGAGPLLPGAQYFDFQTISQDGWRTSVTDISSFAGQNVSLSFSVTNGGDPDFLLQSSLAIDNITISPVPEPGAAVLLAGVPAAIALRRRRKKIA